MHISFLIHVVVALLALCGLLPTLTYTLPVKFHARHVPVLTVALGLLTWYLPTGLDTALALVPLSAVVLRLLNVHVIPDTAADWSPAKAATVRAGRRLRGIYGSVKATAEQCRRKVMRVPPEPEPEITEFAKHAYPDPATVQDDDAGGGADDVPDLEPPAQRTQVRRFVPSLLD